MAPTKPATALIHRQFDALGRPATGTSKKATPRYRCKHCSWEGAASAPNRLQSHLDGCATYQKTLLQEAAKPPAFPFAPPPPPKAPTPIQQTLQRSGVEAITRKEKEILDLAAATAIITDGRAFGLFESTAMRAFFAKLRPGWPPLTRAQVAARLPEIHQALREEVMKQFRGSEHVNIIFDASDNVSGHRIVNISVKLPEDGPAFYWKTFDTGDRKIG